MGKLTNKKIIGLDLDGVIIDHTENRIALAKKFGYSLTPEETVSDIIKKKLPKNTYQKMKSLIYDDPVIGTSSPFVTGAENGLKYLREQKVSHYVISRRDPFDMAIKLLQKRSSWPAYLNEKNVFFVKSTKEKNDMAKELGIDIYLDDQPSVIDALVDVPRTFLFDPLRAYSKRAEYNSYKKVHSWPEFISKLKSL